LTKFYFLPLIIDLAGPGRFIKNLGEPPSRPRVLLRVVRPIGGAESCDDTVLYRASKC